MEESEKKIVINHFLNSNTINDFAILLKKLNVVSKDNIDFNEEYLYYLAYFSKHNFTTFTIPKKRGGVREIYAPNKNLISILRLLNTICSDLYFYLINDNANGFIKNRSIVTNAKYHTNKNYVYNIDLKDFFTHIKQYRVYQVLISYPFKLNKKFANFISHLICYRNETDSIGFLPQGSPVSPILSNFICHKLDKKLNRLAESHNAVYTRYADDITFSSNHNLYQKNSNFIKKIGKIIEDENFIINEKKVRLQKRGYRQEVTGIIVNEGINVPREYIKELRALIHLVKKYGIGKAQEVFNNHGGETDIILTIKGKLNYLKMVRGKNDNRYKKLSKSFNDILLKYKNEIDNFFSYNKL